jgi:hypothetical protein
MSRTEKILGVRMKEKDIKALRKIGAPNLRKPATEARLAILNHIEKHKEK